MTELRRIVKAGLISFKRSGLISWAAILIMTITLSVIVMIILSQALLAFSLNQIKTKVDITIYFNVGTEESKILTFKESIQKLPVVADVSYVSSEEALRLFRERHSSDYSTIQALDEIGENPLGAYLNVKAKEVSQYETIADFLKSDNALALGSDSIIDKINYHQNKIVIDRLNSIITGAQKLSFIITLILIIISIIITLNTIKLTIFISREEIGVMRLVGANKKRVRGPFIVEGAVYGLLSTILTLLIFWPTTAWLGHNMTNFFGMNIYDYYKSNFLQIFLIVLLSGIFLGMVSSFLAIRRHLNR